MFCVAEAHYLALSVTKWTGSATTYELHDKYLENVDDATVKSAIETCVLNKLLFDLTEYEQAAAATYYLFKVNSVELTERNRIAEKDVNELIEKWKIQDKYYI